MSSLCRKGKIMLTSRVPVLSLFDSSRRVGSNMRPLPLDSPEGIFLAETRQWCPQARIDLTGRKYSFPFLPFHPLGHMPCHSLVLSIPIPASGCLPSTLFFLLLKKGERGRGKLCAPGYIRCGIQTGRRQIVGSRARREGEWRE